MKRCPFCAEEILDEALKCKHCGSMLDGSQPANRSRRSTFSTSGLFGAFLAVLGLIIGLGSCVSSDAPARTIGGIIGISLLIIGAGIGSRYK